MKSALVQHSSACEDNKRNTEVPEGSSKHSTYQSNLNIPEAPLGRIQIQSVEWDDLVGIGGMNFHNNSNEKYIDEIYDDVEEDDQFRKRLEMFISKVNDGLRANNNFMILIFLR